MIRKVAHSSLKVFIPAAACLTLSACSLPPEDEASDTASAAVTSNLPPVELVSVFEPAGESNVRSSFQLSEGVGLIGTEETGDIFKTEDSGSTWRKVFDGGDAWGIADVRNYIRAQDGHIYITTTEPATVSRSIDEGEIWETIYTAPADRTVGLVQLDDGSILVGLRSSENNKISIIRSEDYFKTADWIPLDEELPRQNVTCFGYWGGDSVIAGIGFEYSGKIFKSTDGGLTWEQKAEFPDARDLLNIFKSGDDMYVTASGIATLYKSSDGGESWSKAHQFWEKGFLGECESFIWRGQEYLIMSATDQSKDVYRHLVMISADGGESWAEWIDLASDTKGMVKNKNESGGGASNLSVIALDTIVVGTGNHAVQGRAYTLRVAP